MASVHTRPRSPYFHAAFRGPDGRLILRSTKQTNRNDALKVAFEYERASKLAMRGELVETQARNVLNDIMARCNVGEQIQTTTIKDHFNDWIRTKEARRAASTAVRYETVTRLFLESMGERADKPITALTAKDVDKFLNHRLKEGRAPRTAVLDVKIIRTALNAARRKGLIPTNPAEAVDLPDVEGIERGTFTSAEVGMLVDKAEGEWKTLIMVAYYSGARLGDCCNISWGDVSLSGGSMTYTQGKTGHKITVPIHPALLRHLESIAGTDETSPFIMPHMAGLKSGGRHGLSEGFKRIMRKAGLDVQSVKGKGTRNICKRTFHALRHSFASGLANMGVTEEVRMRLTGHKSKAVHRGYTHHELENLKDAVGKLPSLKLLSDKSGS